MSFKGKVVIVTGASSGIGAATAEAFAAAGAGVALVGRNSAKLERVWARCAARGGPALVLVADVCADADAARVVADTLAHFGRLDVLVNNAGIYARAGILAPDAMAVHDRVMDTNLRAVVRLTHLAAPHLVAARGNVVNVSSIASLAVMVENSFSYLTSKAAVDHFTRAVALELAPKGVRVNAVNPGAVRTDIMEASGASKEQSDAMWERAAQASALGRAGEPEEIADLVLFLASDKARSITGSTYVSDNGALLVGLMRGVQFGEA